MTTKVFTEKVMFFKIPQNVTKYFGHIWRNICHTFKNCPIWSHRTSATISAQMVQKKTLFNPSQWTFCFWRTRINSRSCCSDWATCRMVAGFGFSAKYFSATAGFSSAKTDTAMNGPRRDNAGSSLPPAPLLTSGGNHCCWKKISVKIRACPLIVNITKLFHGNVFT